MSDMAKSCLPLTLTFPLPPCLFLYLYVPPGGLTPTQGVDGISEWGLQQDQDIRTSAKENESKGAPRRDNSTPPAINLNRDPKLHPTPRDTLSQPAHLFKPIIPKTCGQEQQDFVHRLKINAQIPPFTDNTHCSQQPSLTHTFHCCGLKEPSQAAPSLALLPPLIWVPVFSYPSSGNTSRAKLFQTFMVSNE